MSPTNGLCIGEPELNDAGQVAFTTVRSDGSDIYTGVYRGDAAGTVDELATGALILAGTAEPYPRSSVRRSTPTGG